MLGKVSENLQLKKIKKSFPHWNMDWILEGKGNPFIDTPLKK
jgi:hypothetical protein